MNLRVPVIVDARLGAIHVDIVIVADQHLARRRIEEDVAEIHVLIAEAVGVQFVEAGRDVQANRGTLGQRQLDPARRCGDERAAAGIARRPQRHDIAKAGAARHFHEVQRPEESLGRRAARNCAGETLAQSDVGLDAGRMIPFQRERHAVDDDLVDLALAARADELRDDAATIPGSDEMLARLQRACGRIRPRCRPPHTSQHALPSAYPVMAATGRKRGQARAIFCPAPSRHPRGSHACTPCSPSP